MLLCDKLIVSDISRPDHRVTRGFDGRSGHRVDREGKRINSAIKFQCQQQVY